MSLTNLPPLTWLRAFESAARLLSFTLAAEELHLTQSAISQHVRRLEGFLGRELFIRRVRSLQLTEAGANYLPIVREAFEILAAGTRNFTNLDQKHSIVLQSNLAFSTFWLAPRLKRFHEKHPGIMLNIVTPIWDPERHADAASIEVRFGLEKDMPDTARLLMHDRYYPVCHPDYARDRKKLSDMHLYDCSGVTSNWASWARDNQIELPANKLINMASTYVIAMTTALNNGCVTMSHDTLAADLIRAGKLIRPFNHQSPLLEGYYLIRPSKLDQNAVTNSVSDWLQEEAQSFNLSCA